MEISLQYFGMLSEETSTDKEQFELAPGTSVGDLIQLIQERHPALVSKAFRIAVNRQLADNEQIIPAQAELAALPPFAGG